MHVNVRPTAWSLRASSISRNGMSRVSKSGGAATFATTVLKSCSDWQCLRTAGGMNPGTTELRKVTATITMIARILAAVGDFVAARASKNHRVPQRSTGWVQQVQYQSIRNNGVPQSSTGSRIWFGTRGSGWAPSYKPYQKIFIRKVKRFSFRLHYSLSGFSAIRPFNRRI